MIHRQPNRESTSTALLTTKTSKTQMETDPSLEPDTRASTETIFPELFSLEMSEDCTTGHSPRASSSRAQATSAEEGGIGRRVVNPALRPRFVSRLQAMSSFQISNHPPGMLGIGKDNQCISACDHIVKSIHINACFLLPNTILKPQLGHSCPSPPPPSIPATPSPPPPHPSQQAPSLPPPQPSLQPHPSYPDATLASSS